MYTDCLRAQYSLGALLYVANVKCEQVLLDKCM